MVSALYSLFASRKKQAKTEGGRFLMQDFADRAGVDKSQPSRWFSGENPPNWKMSTFYELCDALDADVRISIYDRKTGELHTPQGVTRRHVTQTYAGGSYLMHVFIGHSAGAHDEQLTRLQAHLYPVSGRTLNAPNLLFVGTSAPVVQVKDYYAGSERVSA